MAIFLSWSTNWCPCNRFAQPFGVPKVPRATAVLANATVYLPPVDVADSSSAARTPRQRISGSSRDSTAKSAVGPYNICYINGLQSQAHVSNETSDDFCCNITCMNRYGRACNTVFNWQSKDFFT